MVSTFAQACVCAAGVSHVYDIPDVKTKKQERIFCVSTQERVERTAQLFHMN